MTPKLIAIDEIDETFEVTLSFPPDANATAGAKTKATGIIVSDDGPMLNIVNTNTNGAVAEGGNATFEVTLAAPPADDVTVNWTTTDGTAVQPADYTTDSGTLRFTGNEKSKTISVTTINDSFDEPDQENFAIELSGETPANVVYFNQDASVSS